MTTAPTPTDNYQIPACRCGSGLPRRVLADAAGIFCAFVCDTCESDRKAGFNPDIFERDTLYSVYGTEESLP